MDVLIPRCHHWTSIVLLSLLFLKALVASTPCSNCDGNSVTCVDGMCPPRCVSLTSSGECLQCRESRFYGKQCEHDCPDICLKSRCQMNNTRVVCTEGCVAGKKGDNCGVNCPTACTQCERYGEGCTGQCQNPRYYGPQCETPCSSGCTDGCNRITGECGSCEPGYTGDKCDVTCPRNCRDECDKDTGVCGSCEPGYTGDKCDVTCPRNCRDECDKDTGVCGSCEPGYTGDKCDITCPPNCGDGCDKDTGKCGSCKQGYTGKYCDICNISEASCFLQPCSACDGNNVTCVDDVCLPRCVSVAATGQCFQCRDSRFYGKLCEHDCPRTCLSSRCQMENSRVVCTEGCVAGKKGDNCGVDCPTACTQCERYGDGCTGPCQDLRYYGPHCRTPCSSGCTDICNRITGACDRCEPVYTGKYCNVTCPTSCEGGCDKDTGECVPLGQPPLLMWIGSVLLAMVVAASVLLLVVFLWKRRKRRLKELICEMHSLNNNELTPHDSQQNLSSSDGMHTSSCQGDALQRVMLCGELKGEMASQQIMHEFQRLSCPNIEKARYGSLDDNALKNRYRDVLPYDSTRVSLEIDEKNDSDYINASFIDGYKAQVKYIAAQGPSIEVVADFWRMIWQLNITKIVMLTNLVEAGKVKCEMYWPFCSSDFSTYDKVYVQCVEEKVYKNYTLRKLAVWQENSENRIIRQFHFTSWPDHGVPGETTSVLDFHRVVMDTGINSSGPLLVHCSAGIGRTGTFLALDYLLDQARKEGRVCVYTCVQSLRHQRMKMVQTKEQYAFIYKALVSALKMRGDLQRCQNPIAVLCGECWQQRKDNRRSNASLQKDTEYQRLWNCQLQRRNSYLPRSPSPPLDEYAIISENTPPRLHRSLNAYSIDADMDTWMDTSV
ncbi:multiple epidermal growth factor-like domains protein 11 [Haliotis rufescens]|uniref:multiple epidermal growth factor-like domains protein 11 n=1 Tax=Haliotis rufescens TaxID=6454 RepID=UPI00201EA241|nr:multiple epidermal growth factor-like domains protein 11 [Haliotis rufescens]